MRKIRKNKKQSGDLIEIIDINTEDSDEQIEV